MHIKEEKTTATKVSIEAHLKSLYLNGYNGNSPHTQGIGMEDEMSASEKVKRKRWSPIVLQKYSCSELKCKKKKKKETGSANLCA